MRRNHLALCAVVVPAIAIGAAHLVAAPASVGPVAIAMRNAGEGVVLQADGRVLSLDTARRSFKQIYRASNRFEATDIAVGYPGGPDYCLTLSAKTAGEGNFLLQILPGNREVWTHLSAKGLFIGVATDPARRMAYVTEPFANAVFSVPLGAEKAPVTEIASLPLAHRIGPIALDAETQRLFVADMDGSDIFVIALRDRQVKRIGLPKMSDIRALAWNRSTARLYIADAVQGAIWSSDGAGREPAARMFKGGALKSPAGLSALPDGTVWMVDEKAGAAFPLDVRRARVLQSVRVTVGR